MVVWIMVRAGWGKIASVKEIIIIIIISLASVKKEEKWERHTLRESEMFISQIIAKSKKTFANNKGAHSFLIIFDDHSNPLYERYICT